MTFPIERNLTNHPPLPSTQRLMESIRSNAKLLAEAIDGMCPSSRETALALTNLEQSVMWAMAALARGDYDARVQAIAEADEILSGARADRDADAGLDPK